MKIHNIDVEKQKTNYMHDLREKKIMKSETCPQRHRKQLVPMVCMIEFPELFTLNERNS